MSSLKQDIKTKFLHLHVLEKIIVLNTSLFFLGIILNLLGINLLDWFSLPYRFSEVLSHPWSIITYGFLHHSLGHLFFNMLVLYFIAQSFANLFKPRLSFKIYILGVIFGDW